MNCIHENKSNGFRVGDRVWVKSAGKYGMIDRCRLPEPCGDDCFYAPCTACGGDGVDELQKDRRCKSCRGYGRRSA